MRIAFFTDFYLPLVNGVVVCVVETAKKLADRGHKVHIIAPKYRGPEQLKYPNIKIIRRAAVSSPIYKGVKFTLPFDPRLLKYIRKEKIDIIHFHTPITLGLQAILIAKMLEIPLVGTFHGFFMDPQYLKHVKMNYRVVEKFGWKYSNFFYNKCDLISCPSEKVKDEILAHGCKKQISVIHNGIDFSAFDNTNAPDAKRKLNKKGKILLFVGRLAHEKNIFCLLDCFALVLRKLPATKLVLVGEGPQEKLLRKKINALGIANKVILTGQIEHNNLLKSGIFGACDVFVTASTTEVAPVTVLEAQANGLVCVGMKGGGMKDLIQDNVNGFLVESNDKIGFANSIITLLTDQAQYNRMKKATVRKIKNYDILRVIDSWENAYGQLKQAKRR